jgi:hypothetical protein
MRERSHSSAYGNADDNASDAPQAFELTASLLKAKRLIDRSWAREAFASAGWLLSPGPGAIAALLLILANEIVFHASPTTCVRPLDGESLLLLPLEPRCVAQVVAARCPGLPLRRDDMEIVIHGSVVFGVQYLSKGSLRCLGFWSSFLPTSSWGTAP